MEIKIKIYLMKLYMLFKILKEKLDQEPLSLSLSLHSVIYTYMYAYVSINLCSLTMLQQYNPSFQTKFLTLTLFKDLLDLLCEPHWNMVKVSWNKDSNHTIWNSQTKEKSNLHIEVRKNKKSNLFEKPIIKHK